MTTPECENYVLDDQFYISRDENKRHISVMLQTDGQGSVPEWIEVVREGNWSDFFKGEFQYTEETLNNFKANFDNNVLRNADGQIPFNYSHHIGGEAAGWVDIMEIRNKLMQSGDMVKSLWMHVSWTTPAKEAIADRRWKYASIEDLAEWVDPETGKTFFNVLFGTALTNIPFVSELEPAMRLNSTQYKKKEDDNMPDNTEEIKKMTQENTTLKLSNDQLGKDKKSLEEKINTLTKEFKDFKDKINADKTELEKDEAAIKMLEDAVRKEPKLAASILDDPKKTEEFKLAKDSPEAFKLMLSKLPLLSVTQQPKGNSKPANPKGPDGEKKELTSTEFRDKAVELAGTDENLKKFDNRATAYKEATLKLKEQGFSYKEY